jgi:hypothetical protein
MTTTTTDPRPSKTPGVRAQGTTQPGAAWWRFGMVWFVLAGPALVVVAGFATMAIAFRNADVEIHETPAIAAAGATTPASLARSTAGKPGAAAAVSGH